LHLLLRLLYKELCFSNYLLTLLQRLFDLARLLQNAYVVAIGKLIALLLEEPGADVGLLVKFFCLELDVNKVGVFKEAGELIQLGLL